MRLLIGEPEEQTATAWNFVADQSVSPEGPVTLSDMVVGESYFALRHHYSVPHSAAVASLRGLTEDERIRATGVSRSVLASAQRARGGPAIMDRLIHGEYERDGSVMATFDRSAAALPGALLLK